jgi:two-component system, OmpR family, phosphate regulon sensor histidine kinase PhoR
LLIKPASLAILGGVAAVALAVGVDPWLVLGMAMAWFASLWLQKDAPTADLPESKNANRSTDAFAPFLDPLGVPLIVLRQDRIITANAAARAAFGRHIVEQDARVALRHPDAIALLDQPDGATVTVLGLTTPKSVWKLRLFVTDDQLRMIEFSDLTTQADVSKAHTDFVANASHELRTPLASIMGYLETLSDPEAPVDKATSARFLETMRLEARRMQTLISDLMSLSRIEAEKHDPPGEEVDLASAVSVAAGDASALDGSNRVSIDLSVKPAWTLGDRGQIEQLVRNLVDNALKYGEAGAPVRVSLDRNEAGQLIMSVTDTGPGIAAEHVPHLTRRFYRTDPGRSRAAGGTGLGLAIVKHIAERHKAKLDIESELGTGTKISVSFPPARESLS